jgi:hypothetical protein
MHIQKALFMKELMDGKGQGVSNTKNRPKGVGPETQMGNLPQKLKRVLFRL